LREKEKKERKKQTNHIVFLSVGGGCGDVAHSLSDIVVLVFIYV